MKTHTILLIEDDHILAETLTHHLKQKEWRVIWAATFGEAKERLQQDQHDLTILDVNLPDGNGFTLCQEYRRFSEKPVIFLTASDMEMDNLHGYDVGADDYVSKPFSVNIFIRKVEALLRRAVPKAAIYQDGHLTVDLTGMTVSCGQQLLNLSALEFKTLKMFIENAEIVLTRQNLLDKLWDADGQFVDEHALTMAISRLRKKIEDPEHTYIKTIYGLGYIWVGGKM